MVWISERVFQSLYTRFSKKKNQAAGGFQTLIHEFTASTTTSTIKILNIELFYIIPGRIPD